MNRPVSKLTRVQCFAMMVMLAGLGLRGQHLSRLAVWLLTFTEKQRHNTSQEHHFYTSQTHYPDAFWQEGFPKKQAIMRTHKQG